MRKVPLLHPEIEKTHWGSANKSNALPAILVSCFIGLFVKGDIIKEVFWEDI